MKKEVIIIGAGATGLSAAIFLHRKGFHPRILEKRPRAKITKALGVNPVTLQLFEETGNTKRFLANGRKVGCMNFWYRDSLIYKNDFSGIRHPHPYMLVQPQWETEQILEDYLGEKGIVVERSYDLQSLSQSGPETTITFHDAVSRKDLCISTTGIVIGADGSKSKVREATGIAFKGWEHAETFKLYDIELSTPLDAREGHYRFYKEGAMLMLPIRDNVWRVAGNLKDLLAYLPPGTKTGAVSWEADFTISEKVAATFGAGNVHILGDAAHIHSPAGAKGMNMCIEDAHIFASLASEGREGEFTRIRRGSVKSAVGILGKLTQTFAGQSPIAAAIRSNMKRFSFVFPIVMPRTRKFLLGLK